MLSPNPEKKIDPPKISEAEIKEYLQDPGLVDCKFKVFKLLNSIIGDFYANKKWAMQPIRKAVLEHLIKNKIDLNTAPPDLNDRSPFELVVSSIAYWYGDQQWASEEDLPKQNELEKFLFEILDLLLAQGVVIPPDCFPLHRIMTAEGNFPGRVKWLERLAPLVKIDKKDCLGRTILKLTAQACDDLCFETLHRFGTPSAQDYESIFDGDLFAKALRNGSNKFLISKIMAHKPHIVKELWDIPEAIINALKNNYPEALAKIIESISSYDQNIKLLQKFLTEQEFKAAELILENIFQKFFQQSPIETNQKINDVIDLLLDLGNSPLINRFLPKLLQKKGITLEEKESKNALQSANAILKMLLSPKKHLQEIGKELFHKLKIQFFLRQNDSDLNEWVCAAIFYPKIAKLLKPIFHEMRVLNLHTPASSEPKIDRWTVVPKEMLKRAPVNPERPSEHLKEIKTQLAAELKEKKDSLTEISMANIQQQGWKFLRMQGRTILLEHPKKDKILAIKLNKIGKDNDEKTNDIDELIKQCVTERYLKQHAADLHLKSKLPDAYDVYRVTDVDPWLAEQKADPEQLKAFQQLKDPFNSVAYVYEADRSYFNYLDEFGVHEDKDCVDDKFAQANRIIVNDLCTLGLQGLMYDRFAPLYHENLKRRYIVLLNLFGGVLGSGCLEGWLDAIRWSNGRDCGHADWGDWHDEAEISFAKELDTFAREFDAPKLNRNFIKLNVIAEQAYALMLITGARARTLTEKLKKSYPDPNDIYYICHLQHIWTNAAKQTITNCAQFMSQHTSIPEHLCHRFLSNWIDPVLLANQMKFWMTKEYIPSIGDDKFGIPKPIPERVYGKNVRVITNTDANFTEEDGYHVKGENGRIIPDLGSDNGREPITEANKLLYALIMGIQAAKDYGPLFQAHCQRMTQEAATTVQTNVRAWTARKRTKKMGLFANRAVKQSKENNCLSREPRRAIAC